MRTFFGPVLAAVVLALAAGCAGSTEDASASDDALARASSATDADNGKTFTIEKGKPFTVTLSSNATTGYKWSVVSTDRSLGYPTPKDGTYQTGGPGVGAGGKQVFVWKTDSPFIEPSTTAHSVTLEYRRPFEGPSVPATKTFKFKLQIKEGSAAPPPEPSHPVTITADDNGSHVRATEGQDLVVRLAENGTTGYRWLVVSDGALAEPQSDFEAPDPSRVGSGGTRVLTWHTAGKIGTQAIKLKLSRGASGTAAQTFDITVDVVAAGTDEAFECPPASRQTINCMPPTTSSNASFCAADYRSWAQSHCDVSYLD